MRKLRIVHIITGLGMGGAERSLFNILTHTDEQRFEHVVISLTGMGYWGERLERCGIEVYALGMKRNLMALGNLFKLCRLLRDLQADCVQTWLHHANVLGLFCAWVVGQKNVVWNIRCGMLDLAKYRVTTRIVFRIGAWLSRYPRVVINNSRVSISEHTAYGYSKARWLYIANGFDMELFRPRVDAYNNLRIRLGIPSDAQVIGMIARFDPAKDHETFIRAAGILAQQVKNVYFVCVGRGVNEQNFVIRTLLQEHSLQQRIFLLDEISDVEEIYPGLDYITQTSLVEGFPNVIGEAMACGVECVATEVGETATLLGGGNFRIPKSSPGQMAKTWLYALNRSPEAIKLSKQQNREYIKSNFGLQAVANRYEDIYYNLVRN